jgi:16S rRNA (cytidine1402-2'-O)-methyltransferase
MPLFIVATPIGNLEDITLRAIRTLKESHFILAEDTRESAKLLHKYEIPVQMISYRDQNHDRMIPKVLEKLEMGLNLSLISDAGTPTISDPGYKLVHEVKAAGYEVIPIPGPSAVITALSASGLPTDRFTFLGFLPKSDIKRKELIERYMADDSSLIIFESPARLVDLLKLVSEIDPERHLSVANNLTKLKEKIDYGTSIDIYKKWEANKGIKGEFVVSISKALNSKSAE